MRIWSYPIEFPIPSKKNRYEIRFFPPFWLAIKGIVSRFRKSVKQGRLYWIDKDLTVARAETALSYIAKTHLPKDIKPPVVLEVELYGEADIDNSLGVIFESLHLSGRLPDDNPRVISELHVYHRGPGEGARITVEEKEP